MFGKRASLSVGEIDGVRPPGKPIIVSVLNTVES